MSTGLFLLRPWGIPSGCQGGGQRGPGSGSAVQSSSKQEAALRWGVPFLPSQKSGSVSWNILEHKCTPEVSRKGHLGAEPLFLENGVPPVHAVGSLFIRFALAACDLSYPQR